MAVSKNQILIDGGLQAGKGLVECAERITLSFKNGEVHLEEHAVFRTLARMLHTLTLIPTPPHEERVVLAHGGFGRPPTVEHLEQRRGRARQRLVDLKQQAALTGPR